jgi:kynurenine formamidase
MVRIIDLSLDIYDGAPTFAPDPTTSVEPHLRIPDLGYNITRLSMSTHFGTHLDAPFHFFDDGETVEQLDPRLGFGPAVVVDLRHKGRGEEIVGGDLEPYAPRLGRGGRVILHTGWDKEYPEPHYFSEQPYIGLPACEWLAERGISTVAMDMPTIYPGEYVKAHHILLGAKVLVIEGLARLDQLTTDEVILVALPLRIRGRDGSPCRAVALEAGDTTEWDALQRLLGAMNGAAQETGAKDNQP